MRWTPGGRSQNIEDRRDGTGGLRLGGGGVRLGLGGTLILLILSVIFRRDFFSLFNAPDSGLPAASGTRVNRALDAREEPLVQFVSFVLDDAQNTWRQILLAKRV